MLNYTSDTFKQLSFLYGNLESYGRARTSLEAIRSEGWGRSDFSYLESLGYVIRTESDITITDTGIDCYFRTFDNMIG